jgi:hypothetical protein
MRLVDLLFHDDICNQHALLLPVLLVASEGYKGCLESSLVTIHFVKHGCPRQSCTSWCYFGSAMVRWLNDYVIGLAWCLLAESDDFTFFPVFYSSFLQERKLKVLSHEGKTKDTFCRGQ